ncbi:MAG: YciI family protein [Sphingobacteriales bacterium]
MDKKYFALKLIPCRPTFAQDMTDEERSIMQQHVVYWRGLMDKGMVIVFGPVMDPKGTYGLGIIAVDDEAEVRTFIANDPASKINTYEFHPMRAVVKG